MQQNIPRHSTKEESSKRYIRKLAKCLSFCKFSVFYLVVSLNCCKFAALNYPYKIIYYMNRTIITVVGKDTKGIIARVCTYLAEKDVNILDISQTIVQEYFNMMMIVDMGKMNTSFETVADELADLGKSIGVQVKCQREEIFNMKHRI